MDKNDMILVSVDDHIIEPPDMFVNHLPKKYVDDAPRLVHMENGADMWKFRDRIIPNVALNAVAGRPKEEYGLEPEGLDEIRPGCYDVHERVKDMNAGGVLAQMNFPSFPASPLVCSRPRTPNSRSHSSRPTTTGTSKSGVVHTPADSSRWAYR